MCRAGPRLSAATSAQNPGGSVRPPLSGSHIGRVCPLTPATSNPSAPIAPTIVTARVLLRFTTLLPARDTITKAQSGGLYVGDYGRIHSPANSDEELIKSSDIPT